MIRKSFVPSVGAGLTMGVLAILPAVVSQARGQTPSVDPEAVELLTRSLEFFSEMEAFGAQTWNLREDLLDSGQRVDFESEGSVLVKRPNKLRGYRHNGPVVEAVFYDGKSVTFYNDLEGTYATLDAPATIEEMFLLIYESVELYPVSDLIWQDALPYMMDGVTLAQVIGVEEIGGIACTHLLFSRPDVDFQIWIPVTGPPLPTKYIVTDNAKPEMLSIVTYIGDYDLDPVVSDDDFEFVPPADATEVPFPTADADDESNR